MLRVGVVQDVDWMDWMAWIDDDYRDTGWFRYCSYNVMLSFVVLVVLVLVLGLIFPRSGEYPNQVSELE